jgi:hypothetical protein
MDMDEAKTLIAFCLSRQDAAQARAVFKLQAYRENEL